MRSKLVKVLVHLPIRVDGKNPLYCGEDCPYLKAVVSVDGTGICDTGYAGIFSPKRNEFELKFATVKTLGGGPVYIEFKRHALCLKAGLAEHKYQQTNTYQGIASVLSKGTKFAFEEPTKKLEVDDG